MFNASDLIVAEEIGLEVARQVTKPEIERKNDLYVTDEIPLTVKHDCHSIDIPIVFDTVNFARFKSSPSAYKYRINHGDWISISSGYKVEVEDFEINTLDVSNDVGTGILSIYLEGIRK